jgi:hypothetical protein
MVVPEDQYIDQEGIVIFLDVPSVKEEEQLLSTNSSILKLLTPRLMFVFPIQSP